MVILKANKAEGSFLGRGTHVWLEVTDAEGNKTTFSGVKNGRMLDVIRDYKRDYDRDAARGLLEISPPDHLTEDEWSMAVLSAAEEVLDEMHGNYAFNGIFPWGKTSSGIPRSNCCCVAQNIIKRAGGEIPDDKIKGVLPGLGRGWRDYL